MFESYSEAEMRNECRLHIEAFEHWGRRLIHEKLNLGFGEDYFKCLKPDGSPLFKKEMLDRIQSRIDKDKKSFPRNIDAVVIEDIIYILCREDLYNGFFKEALEYFYKEGKEEVRTFLSILASIRNKLNHANPISYREAEQAICYSNDFISCLMQYYRAIGKERKYNVPTIIKVADSFGNCMYRENSEEKWSLYEFVTQQIRSGDKYKIWVDVDPGFLSSDYNITWTLSYGFEGKKKVESQEFNINFTNDMVGTCVEINCYIKSNKEWHQHHFCDDYMTVYIREILPPINDSY